MDFLSGHIVGNPRCYLMLSVLGIYDKGIKDFLYHIVEEYYDGVQKGTETW